MPQGVPTPPEIAAQVIARHQAGEPGAAIAPDSAMSKMSVSRLAVRRVNGGSPERVPDSLVTREKRRLTKGFYKLARLARDQAEAEVGALGGYQAALVAGIAVDKALLLSGEAAMAQVQVGIVEVRGDGLREVIEAKVVGVLQQASHVPQDSFALGENGPGSETGALGSSTEVETGAGGGPGRREPAVPSQNPAYNHPEGREVGVAGDLEAQASEPILPSSPILLKNPRGNAAQPPDLPPGQRRAYAAFLETGTIKGAARLLGITPPSARDAIRAAQRKLAQCSPPGPEASLPLPTAELETECQP